MSSSLAALKQQLAEVLPAERPSIPGVSTGVVALDAALEGRGIPRGRLTEVIGAQGSGRTTLVRRIVEEAVGEKLWVAYVDAARTLAPRDWAHLGGQDGRDALGSAFGGVWMVRPRDPARGAWCADVLLRSGAFGLVVLDGAPLLARGIAVRLTRLARDTNAALVVVGDERGGSAVPGALRLRVDARRGRPPRPPGRGGGRLSLGAAGRDSGGPAPGRVDGKRFAVAVEKGGDHRTVEVSCAIGVARRLCADPEVPDRRGVPDRAAHTGAAADAVRTLARKRRCAEPDFGQPVAQRVLGGSLG